MAFVGRVLLSHIRHVPKARVLSVAACSWWKLPAIAAAQTRMVSSSQNEGKLSDMCRQCMAVCASLVAQLNLV